MGRVGQELVRQTKESNMPYLLSSPQTHRGAHEAHGRMLMGLQAQGSMDPPRGQVGTQGLARALVGLQRRSR